MASGDLELEVSQLRKRIESLEERLPDTMLLSRRFVDRAVAVFFLSVTGNLVVGLLVGALWLVVGILGSALGR